jgi:hypothetical protein
MKLGRLHFLVLGVALLVVLGCKPRNQVDALPPETPVVVVPPVEEPPVVVPPGTGLCGSEISRGTAPMQDAVASMEGTLEGDCLWLKLAYSGGCKEHFFDLYWSGDWDKTKPPVAHLYLAHNSNGDACEAIKSEKLGFALNRLRFPGNGQVIVEVHAEGVGMVRVNYVYGHH